VRGNWLRISTAVEQALEKIPLTEMAAPRSSGLLTLGETLHGAGTC
jgi:hypothetical protein